MRTTILCLVLLVAAIETGCGGQPPQDNPCIPPVPRLDEMQPTAAKSHSPSVLLTVRGSHFVRNAVVFFDGHAISTTYISAQELRSVVPFELLLKVGPVNVDVFNPANDSSCPSFVTGMSQASNALVFTLAP
ncbi:MAG TPA: IPT/TIG domain-containing protein [Terriglobales bacterium]|nr:IPT/TIG domain-containing protein [Terriglobales bacterium]